ncbi:NAD(P)/FAD-dependent oxidoreductase [Pseudonocardia eucalypti]|uniref:NAD(P)/FAD-dependent oxidoreductase n=1 Tax=Pseudonocardia eucalypti TaxID=648755 RepID=A0ABP9PIN5_9PSEU|nr:NADH dehydrogenase [Pseudonocardia eucalypti]
MSNVLIIGGGFAGVWSAAAAVRLRESAGVSERDLSVTLVSAGDDMVIRPRLYQAEPEKMRVSLDRVLGPLGVRRVAATVTGVDTGRREVTAVGRDGRPTAIGYDRLVLATGSQLVRPELPGAEHLHNVDTMPAAAALDAHLHRLPTRPDAPGRFTAAVVGAGFTGLEIATELVDRLRVIARPHGAEDQVRVVLVERADAVGPELGAGPRPDITKALDALGVEPRVGVSVTEVRADGVRLTDGTDLAADTVVWTAGMLASPLTADIPAGRDRLGRLDVDEYLRVAGVPGVYAAGDTAAARAEEGHFVTQSCQHAGQLGKLAGHNVAAELLGVDLEAFDPIPYVTCLDLGSAGAVFSTGWERTVESTGETAKARKRMINEVVIYPPVDDPEETLRRADFRISHRDLLEPQAS